MLDDRLQPQRERADTRSDDRGQEPDRDRPEKLGAGGASHRREIGHREGERPEPRPVVEPDVDERADAGGEQARNENDAHQRAPDPGHFHEQERRDERGAEQGGDGGEATGRPQDDARHLRRIALDQVNREHAQTAADRDQRRLRAEHDAKAERRERRDHDARELDRLNRPRGLEALGGLVARRPRQILDREGDEEPAQREKRDRPPGGLAAEAELVREGREDILLRLRDRLEEEVGDRGHGDADQRAEHEQNEIAPTAKQLGPDPAAAGVWRRRGAGSVTTGRARARRRGCRDGRTTYGHPALPTFPTRRRQRHRLRSDPSGGSTRRRGRCRPRPRSRHGAGSPRGARAG